MLCPRLPLYFDFLQDTGLVAGRNWNGVLNRVTDVYNFPDRQVSADELNSKLIMGIQANIWTETIESEKRLDFMLFPRIAGLAEAAWTAPDQKNELAFTEKLKADFKNYDAAGIYYYNPFEPTFHPEVVDFVPRVKLVKARSYVRHASKRGHGKVSRKKHSNSKKDHKSSKRAHKKRK